MATLTLGGRRWWERLGETLQRALRPRGAEWRAAGGQLAFQRQLRLSEWRYRSLVEATAAIVWNTPASGEFAQEQPQWTAFTGQSFEQLKGWGWLSAVHPQDREQTAREWSEAVTHAAPFTTEHRLLSARGEYRDMVVRAVPIFDDNNALVEWMGVHTDVTQRRRMEEQVAERERFFRQLIEGLPHFSWTCDNAGRFDYLTHRWYEYSGSRTREPISEGSPTHVHPGDQERLRDAWRQATTSGNVFRMEVRLRRHDGVYRWFEAYATPVRDSQGNINQWFGCSIDIDDRKRAEEALRRSEMRLRSVNGSLERRVRERTAEVETRSEQLRAVALDLAETESRERKRLAQLLHDHFQQLVSAAKLKVGVVRRRNGDEQTVDSMRQIESLLDEAIIASRSLATELSPPVLHDGGLIAAMDWLTRRMERNHALSVALDVEGECEPDNEQVRVIMFECVRELLFNITKHADTHQAWLSVRMLGEGLLHVQVRDEGKGFDAVQEEVKKHLDGSFGLFSIRERLSLIGGLMRITSSPGHGATVDLTVPSVVRKAPPVDRREPAPREALPAPMAHLRVVVADDHQLYREGLMAMLAQESYLEVVGQAGDGEEAVEVCQQLKPDVLIVDISMPRLNGVQVTSILAKQFPAMQIIGLSMHEQDDMAQAMRDAGAVAYFSKSGAPEETLLNALRAAAKRDQQQLQTADAPAR
jgi:PAS domain S-box-containing protein